MCVDDFPSSDAIRQYLEAKKLDLLEERIDQHEQMASLFPQAVNTIRVMTVIDATDKAKVLGASLRMSVERNNDNFSTGGISAPVDWETGEVIGPAVPKWPPRKKHYYHPVTSTAINGFQIPMWTEVRELIYEVLHVVPEVRTVGWDVAITPNGPILVEGNHNWNADVWQIPLGRGCRSTIEEFLRLA